MIANDTFLETLLRETGIEDNAARLPERMVAQALASEYALSGRLRRIDTEKDDTFKLNSDRGCLLVKVAPALEARQVVDLQSAAIMHVGSRAPQIPIQRLVRGVDDQVHTSLTDPAGRPRVMRVFRYIDGSLLHQVAATPRQLGQTGAMLARLDDALADFRHPCESRLLLWDLTHFGQLRELMSHVAESADRELAQRVFDDFEAEVMPVVPGLETQVIHGDYSPFNIVVDPASPQFVKGVIDFGDVSRSPVVFELSVAAANQLGVVAADPWGSAVEIVRGYREVRALRQEDVELLACTAPARLLLRALIYGWRAAREPRLREYAQAHSALDWQRLRRALAIDPAAVRATLAATDPSFHSSRED